MSLYMLKLNPQRCIGCKACEVHCQSRHGIPPETKLGLLITSGPQSVSGKPKIASAFMPCFHCEQPWCLAACPTGAMKKHEADGIIYVEQSLCVGCKGCVEACPWGVPQWDETIGKVRKCDYCRDRLIAGQGPACVAGCTARALTFFKANDGSRKAREAFALALTTDSALARRPG